MHQVKPNGKKIRGLRKLKRLSQEELGEKIGLSKGFISKIENEKGNMSILTLFQLAEFFKVDAKELIKIENGER